MILTVAVVVFLIGSIAYVGGALMGRPDVALIGAILIIGLGGTAMTDGIVVKTGEVQTTTNNTTTIEHTYEEVSIHPDFPLGAVVLLLGGVMSFHAIGLIDEVDWRMGEGEDKN